jgi:glycosyltransferase involved in cell wall biosynthesis
MKILHIHSLFHPNVVGGAERSLQALAEAQLSRGHLPVVLSLSPQAGVRIGQVNGVKVYYVHLKNIYWPFGHPEVPVIAKPLWHAIDAYNPFMASVIGDILDAEAIDVVHTHNLTGFSVSVWRQVKQRGLPLVHTLHDYSLLCPKTTMFYNGQNCVSRHWLCRFYSHYRITLSQTVDCVCAVSQFTLDRHLQAGAFTKVPDKRVIYNFRSFNQGSVCRNRMKLENSPLVLGFIGQLTPAKGIELLLEVVTRMASTGWELRVAGKGRRTYEELLSARYARDNVRFLGFTEPAAFYSQIDVLVVPSLWHEPFGGVIIEAYSYAIPVIAAARGGIPEIVEDMVTGLLFDPDRSETLRASLEAFLDDRSLASTLGGNAYRKAQEFSANRICQEYDAVYSRIVRSGHRDANNT